MVPSSSNFYQLGASLPVDAPSYVQRQADEEFYQKLRSGKFCYVLNSRQMGKSSLRVQTMQKLQRDGTICAAIDLTGIGKHKVTLSQWYGGIVYALVESCQLEDKFDFDWQTWWQKKQETLDPVMCLRLFIEQVLLEKFQQPIVIFVDEIDRVLSQDFSLDDFFALIRFFQNQRVDNPIFERLTFALLGVATPSDLITDKTQTPFNIGEGIELYGFRLSEVQPLINGLKGKVSNPQQVMEEILDWTGGQPFLTQKLCKFMVNESEKDNPRSVREVVRARIIENWESQDNPEHLRTIRDRILSNEQRASYLLELYQQIRQAEEQTEADDTLEQSELQLSGLVVKQHNKLRVYNPIYKEVFNSYWIKNQLKNLRPYSENFKFWVDSKGTDESRLLRGKALQEAEEWAKDKNLSYQDKQYLAASKEKEIKKEIAAKEQKSALEREQKNREAAEKRNQVLSEANKKAQRRISIGFVVLVITVLGAATVGLFSKKQLDEVQEQVEAVRQLNKLAGELQKNSNSDSEELTIIEKVTFDSNEALRLSALSLSIDNHQLKQALVFAVRGQAYQQLKKLKEAEQQFTQSQEFLLNADKNAKDSSEGLQIQVLFHKFQGSLLAQNKETLQAIESYNKAFDILKKHPKEIDFTKSNPLVTAKDIESFHRIFIELLSKNNTEPELRKWVEESLTQHLYAQLEYYLKAKDWRAADQQTYLLMLNIGQGEELESDVNFDNFSCPHLEKIDSLWVANSDKRFGFSVQKKILIEIGNTLSEREDRYVTEKEIYENFLQLAKAIGLYRNGSKVQDKVNLDEEVVSDGDVGRGELDLRGKFVYFDPNFIGSLPLGYGELGRRGLGSGYGRLWVFMSTIEIILSRFATCKQ